MTISRNLSALAQYIASGGILGQTASLPTQTSNSGKFLTTDGTTASWGTVSALPSQTGNSGKFLSTDGTSASWSTVSITPAAVSNQQNTSTGAFGLPVGTTAQRPATPYNGYYRVNTTTNNVEMYYNGLWYNMQYIGTIAATGGTVTTSGNYKIHTFTQSGSFAVTDAPTGATAEVLIVGGGGGGGISLGGGGGGAAVFYHSAKSVSTGSYAITIGAGGTYTAIGSSTLAFGETVTGGGGGADRQGVNNASASAGANGGGGASDARQTGATGIVPSKADSGFTVYAGKTGGSGVGGGGNYPGAGGAGAGANGVTPANNSAGGGAGGVGVSIGVTGFGAYYWAGGGGGSTYQGATGGAGGSGGGGGGASGAGTGTGGAGGTLGLNNGGTASGGGSSDSLPGGPGGANTGGGGGCGSHSVGLGGQGGSGIVVISYRYQ
jgi:hypothetical protein